MVSKTSPQKSQSVAELLQPIDVKTHPLVKITAVLCMGISTIFFPSLWLGASFLIIIIIVSLPCHLIKGIFKLFCGFGLPLVIMLVFIQGGFADGNKTLIVNILGFNLWLEGTLHALRITSAILVFLTSFYIFNSTTPPIIFVRSLQQIGVPQKVNYLILASLNVVPQMQRKMAIIKQAQAARGLSTRGNIIKRCKAFIPLLGPVVMSSLTDSLERGITLETRGFGLKGVRVTHLRKLPFRRRDFWLLLGTITFFIITIVLTVLWNEVWR